MRSPLALLTMPLTVLGLAACTGGCPPGLDDPFPYALNDPGPIIPFDEEFDRWYRSRGIEGFLRKALKDEGIVRLAKHYELQCTPRIEANACADCYSCTKTFPTRVTVDRGPGPISRLVCEATGGETSLRAEFGPGETVFAETYKLKARQ